MWDEEDEGRARISLTVHDMTIAGKCLPLHKDLLTFSIYLTENCSTFLVSDRIHEISSHNPIENERKPLSSKIFTIL
jgi:hypothetical protein